MNGKVWFSCLGLLSVIAAFLALGRPVLAQTGSAAAGTPVRKTAIIDILSNRNLWGPDGLSALLSLQAWRVAGERQVSVLRGAVLSETPLRIAQQAEIPAEKLNAALKSRLSPIAPALSASWKGSPASPPQEVAVNPKFFEDRSVRIMARDQGARYLPEKFMMSDVLAQLGAPEKTERVRIESPGETRPLVVTLHSYANGAIMFAESSFGSARGQITRIVLNVPAVSAVVFKEAK